MSSISSWRSVFTLIFFIIANGIIIFPFSIKIGLPCAPLCSASRFLKVPWPKATRADVCCSTDTLRLKLKLNYATAPVLIVFFLWATTAIDSTIVRQGIVGANGVQPIVVMAFFICLAYLTVSLDKTGLFAFLAVWVAKRGKSSGRRLYLLLYIFFFACGTLFGNDPVILSGTPFLANFTKYSGIDPPTAWIYSEFIAANTAAAILPPSNLTNLVITSAFSLSFLSYAAHAAVPTLLVGAACYLVLRYWWFRSPSFISETFNLGGRQSTDAVVGTDRQDPEAAIAQTRSSEEHDLGKLSDRSGAIFGSILFITTLLVLLGTSIIHIPVWWVTVPAAVLMIMRDIVHDWRQHRQQSAETRRQDAYPLEDVAISNPIHTITPSPSMRSSQTMSLFPLKDQFQKALPTFSTVLDGLPLSMLPFSFSMFILVQALTSTGWIEVFSKWWEAWVRVSGPSSSDRAVVGAIFGMLIISTFMCNICGTNIGATILLSQILTSWFNNADASGQTIRPGLRIGSIYALALGTNFGAYSLTVSGSLAGLLWQNILRRNGAKRIDVRLRDFAYNCAPFIGVAIAVSSVALFVEVKIIEG